MYNEIASHARTYHNMEWDVSWPTHDPHYDLMKTKGGRQLHVHAVLGGGQGLLKHNHSACTRGTSVKAPHSPGHSSIDADKFCPTCRVQSTGTDGQWCDWPCAGCAVVCLHCGTRFCLLPRGCLCLAFASASTHSLL